MPCLRHSALRSITLSISEPMPAPLKPLLRIGKFCADAAVLDHKSKAAASLISHFFMKSSIRSPIR
jgi:hypothetical protein